MINIKYAQNLNEGAESPPTRLSSSHSLNMRQYTMRKAKPDIPEKGVSRIRSGNIFESEQHECLAGGMDDGG